MKVTLDLLEQFLVTISVGTHPQPQPVKLLVALKVLKKIEFSPRQRRQCTNTPIWDLAGKGPIQEVEFSDEEALILVETMIAWQDWSTDSLAFLIPLWERLGQPWSSIMERKLQSGGLAM